MSEKDLSIQCSKRGHEHVKIVSSRWMENRATPTTSIGDSNYLNMTITHITTWASSDKTNPT